MTVALRLAAVAAVVLAAAAGAWSAGAADPLHAQIESARAQEERIAAELVAQSDRITAVQAQVAVLASEVDELERRLVAARGRLAELDERLAEQGRSLRRLDGELAAARTQLAERVVELYTSDQPELVDVLLGAETLGGVIDQLAFYNDVLEQDDRLVETVQNAGGRVRTLRAETRRLAARQREMTERLARQTAARRAAYERVVAERDRLTALRESRQRTLASLEVRREDWEAEAEALAAQGARVAALSQGPVAPAASAGPGAAAAAPSAGFAWPVRGSVVSPFGQRWGRLHAGVDIAAPAGTPIAASAAGTVVFSGSMSGYGNIVVIQHADGIATAYAHNAANLVGAGQAVSQGQTIATVGCTGSCSGDHVHFEVRVGGSPVDPMGYI